MKICEDYIQKHIFEQRISNNKYINVISHRHVQTIKTTASIQLNLVIYCSIFMSQF